MDGDLDGVTLTVEGAVVEDDIVFFILAHGDGLDEFAGLVFGEHLVSSLVEHADGGLGVGGQLETGEVALDGLLSRALGAWSGGIGLSFARFHDGGKHGGADLPGECKLHGIRRA